MMFFNGLNIFVKYSDNTDSESIGASANALTECVVLRTCQVQFHEKNHDKIKLPLFSSYFVSFYVPQAHQTADQGRDLSNSLTNLIYHFSLSLDSQTSQTHSL